MQMEFRIMGLGNRGMRCRKEIRGPQPGILRCVKAGQRRRGRQGRGRKKATQGGRGAAGLAQLCDDQRYSLREVAPHLEASVSCL